MLGVSFSIASFALYLGSAVYVLTLGPKAVGDYMRYPRYGRVLDRRLRRDPLGEDVDDPEQAARSRSRSSVGCRRHEKSRLEIAQV
jgi:hypothetical protein